jgi:hypothetical protein|tara:strand:+ start:38 stop:862 length:825 start_codon:yes stop_codon:yes gene_type:complete
MSKNTKEELTVEAPIMEAPVATKKQTKKIPEWEVKDRVYLLKGNTEPLTYTLGSKHTRRYPLLWFDPSKNEQRELRYATNQNSPFVDEQKGESTLGHIVFEKGVLKVPKEKQNLQKLLSLYHPKTGIIYTEFLPLEIAKDELADLDLELDAMNAAKNMEIDHAEAVLRVEKGSEVTTMSSKEIKRDLLLMARKNPKAFMEIAGDENVGLRNTGIRAVEQDIIKISQDQREFHWGSNNRKLFTIPFDENPYSALAAWFKTDEGVEVFKTIEKKLQ